MLGGGEDEKGPNTAFVEGVRKFAMNVTELDIDLIDSINPFGEAYSILAKTMNEESLRQVQAIISAKRCTATIRMVERVNQDERRRGQPEVGRSPAVG